MRERLQHIDLKLLMLFEQVDRTRSVSQAALELGLSQPTVSIGLARLREFFADPLFVRTSGGMAPTPRAQALRGPVSRALDDLDAALRNQAEFDPAAADHAFRLCTTDISQVVMAPRLLNHLGERAPRARVEILNIDSDTPRLLEAGEVDLAIGFMPDLDAGFYQQTLFEQRFVCLVRSGHPRIGKRLGARQFASESHIEVMTASTGHSVVDKALARHGIRRRIALRVPSFLGIPLIVASTDLIVTVPARLAESLTAGGVSGLEILEPPVALPAFDVRQHWHRRFHDDPRNRWLRRVIAELFGGGKPGATRRGVARP